MSINRPIHWMFKNNLKTLLKSEWILDDKGAEEVMAAFSNQLIELQQHVIDIKNAPTKLFPNYEFLDPKFSLTSQQIQFVETKLQPLTRLYRDTDFTNVDIAEFVTPENIQAVYDLVLSGRVIASQLVFENNVTEPLHLQEILLKRLSKEFPTIDPKYMKIHFSEHVLGLLIEANSFLKDKLMISSSDRKIALNPNRIDKYELERLTNYLKNIYHNALEKKYDGDINEEDFKKKSINGELNFLNSIEEPMYSSFSPPDLHSDKFVKFMLEPLKISPCSAKEKAALLKSIERTLLVSPDSAEKIFNLFSSQLDAFRDQLENIKNDFILNDKNINHDSIKTYQSSSKNKNPDLIITPKMSEILRSAVKEPQQAVSQLKNTLDMDSATAYSLLSIENLKAIPAFVYTVKKEAVDLIQDRIFLLEGIATHIISKFQATERFPNIKIKNHLSSINNNFFTELKNANEALEKILLLTRKERINVLMNLERKEIANMPGYLAAIKSNAMTIIQNLDRAACKAGYENEGINFFSTDINNRYRENPIRIFAPKFMNYLLSTPTVYIGSGDTRLAFEAIMRNQQKLEQGLNDIALGRSIDSIHLNLESLPAPLAPVPAPNPAFFSLANITHNPSLIVGAIATMALAKLCIDSLRRRVNVVSNVLGLSNAGKNAILVNSIEAQKLPKKDLLSDAEIAEFEKYIETIRDKDIQDTNLNALKKYKDFLNDTCSISLTERIELTDQVSIEITKQQASKGIFYVSTYDKESLVEWISKSEGLAIDPMTRDELFDKETETEKKQVKIFRGYPEFIKQFVIDTKNALALIKSKPDTEQSGLNLRR